MYKIVRFYEHGRQRVMETNLTLEEAQTHCEDPETSSKNCTKPSKKAVTRKHGKWFDGYIEQ